MKYWSLLVLALLLSALPVRAQFGSFGDVPIEINAESTRFAFCQRAQFVCRTLERAKNGFNAFGEHLPRRSQFDPPSRAKKERRAQRAFQLGDLSAQRRPIGRAKIST